MTRTPKKEFTKHVGPPKPLTVNEALSRRLEEEKQNREEIRCLQEEYRSHEAELRRLEALKRKNP